MRRLRKYSRLSLLPAIIWIAAQIQVAFAMAAVSPASPGAGTFPLATIVLCTPDGPLTLDAADAFPDENPKEDRVPGHCPWCHAFAAIDLPQRAAAPDRSVPPVPAAWPSGSAAPCPGTPRSLWFQSRAPPIQADITA